MKKVVLLLAAAVLALCLAACGSPKVEITSLKLSETQMLDIQCTAGSRIPSNEGKIKISVSSDEGNIKGTVYCYSELKEDLEKGRSYIFLFDMSQERSWEVGQDGLKISGTLVSKELQTAEILSLFGDDPTITASFLINNEVIAEKVLEKG